MKTISWKNSYKIFNPVKFLSRTYKWMPVKPLFENTDLMDDERHQYYRTPSNQSNNTIDFTGQIYRFPMNDYKKIFGVGRSFRSHIIGQIATFQELGLMIRPPALEIMHYLQNTNLDSLINRYILYGPNGAGKSMTIAHLLHYLYHVDNFITFHVPHCAVLTVKYKEIVPSSTNAGKFDLPFEANFLLKHFKSQNEHKLKAYPIVTTKEYVWSKREKTEKGSPILDVINLGIERPLYATDIVAILFKELKLQAPERGYKLMVLADAINALVGPSRVLNERKKYLDCTELALVQTLRRMLKNDWTHGAAISSVDDQYRSGNKDVNESYMPKHLLGSEGFELMDPFVPVRVENYSESEHSSMVDYYADMKWLQHPEAQNPETKREIYYITGGNGLDLYNFSRLW